MYLLETADLIQLETCPRVDSILSVSYATKIVVDQFSLGGKFGLGVFPTGLLGLSVPA